MARTLSFEKLDDMGAYLTSGEDALNTAKSCRKSSDGGENGHL
jgi:hypothetical protein